MHLIQSLKKEFCFDLPMFSKYPATSINSYFYRMTLIVLNSVGVSLINKNFKSNLAFGNLDESEEFILHMFLKNLFICR